MKKMCAVVCIIEEGMHERRLLVPSASKREGKREGRGCEKIKNQICVSVTHFHDAFRENFLFTSLSCVVAVAVNDTLNSRR